MAEIHEYKALVFISSVLIKILTVTSYSETLMTFYILHYKYRQPSQKTITH